MSMFRHWAEIWGSGISPCFAKITLGESFCVLQIMALIIFFKVIYIKHSEVFRYKSNLYNLQKNISL